MKLRKLMIATSVALSLSLSFGATASTERNNIADQSTVKKYVAETSVSKRAQLKPEITEILAAHKDKDNYFSHKILYTLHSDKDSGFYSLYSAEQALEKMATVNNGLFATYSINEYSNPKSPFYNPEKAASLSIKCAESGNEACLITLYDKALLDESYSSKLTPVIKSKMLESAKKGFKSNHAKFVYARAVGTGLVNDNGKADAMLREAARDLHAPSLDMVINLYKEEFYQGDIPQNVFFYSYLRAISTRDISKASMTELFALTKVIPPKEIESILRRANTILHNKNFQIPRQFLTP